MSKTVLIYCVENGDDLYCLSDSEIAALGKTPKDVEDECQRLGYWIELTLKKATAGLERALKAKALAGDDLAGFRLDETLLPAARFATCVESWVKKSQADQDKEKDELQEAPSLAAFFALDPNLTDRMDLAIRKHLRPHATDDPFFLAMLSANLPPSAETNPS